MDKSLTDWSTKVDPKPPIDSELEARFDQTIESVRKEYTPLWEGIRDAKKEYHAKLQEFSKPYRAKIDALANELAEKSAEYSASIKPEYEKKIEELKAKAALLSEESGIPFGCCPEINGGTIRLVTSEQDEDDCGYSYTATEEYFPTTFFKWDGVSKEAKGKHHQRSQLHEYITVGAWYHSGIC